MFVSKRDFDFLKLDMESNKIAIKSNNEVIDKLKNFVNELSAKINTLSKQSEENSRDIRLLNEESLEFREAVNLRIRKVNGLVSEKLDSQKEDTEALLIGLEKTFQNKLNTLSDGKPLVTELLKRIAHLESIKDAITSRRSTEDILAKIGEVDAKRLDDEINERPTADSEHELKVLRWALGDA